MAKRSVFTSVEVCAGAGGQALGLEQAGFEHLTAVEIDAHAVETLKLNRPNWRPVKKDLWDFDGREFRGADLLAGGVPCPPFSIAGKQLGKNDERDLFPRALDLIDDINPRAVLLENVRGLASRKFDEYRATIIKRLNKQGFEVKWELLNACDYGVPQLRPRFLLVALRPEAMKHFKWPAPSTDRTNVADVITDLMEDRGWPHADEWAKGAARIAPTVVGGSKKHGGPDLGPTRARREWATLGVDGRGIANEAPGPDFPKAHFPRLTLRMVARIQGFPDDWKFFGGKTAAYRQVGNAFPPPVAAAVGAAIRSALVKSSTLKRSIARPIQSRLVA
ncbi:MAG: DNA cytosine methyltransferase [Archangium sp.]|nr:DNA cytosine methyltransferase [Archangium sp.]MDP3574302.1 DNA cytosine methyltransferase [Archangium sp.]